MSRSHLNELCRNSNGGDLQKCKSRAFTIKAGDLTLLLVAERSPWETSRDAWLVGCGELLGGITAGVGADRTLAVHEQPQEEKEEEDDDQRPHDHMEAHERGSGHEQVDDAVTAWYQEVGNVLWCKFEDWGEQNGEQDGEGQPRWEYEDLLSRQVLDLTQHAEPEHYWYW